MVARNDESGQIIRGAIEKPGGAVASTYALTTTMGTEIVEINSCFSAKLVDTRAK